MYSNTRCNPRSIEVVCEIVIKRAIIKLASVYKHPSISLNMCWRVSVACPRINKVVALTSEHIKSHDSKL